MKVLVISLAANDNPTTTVSGLILDLIYLGLIPYGRFLFHLVFEGFLFM